MKLIISHIVLHSQLQEIAQKDAFIPHIFCIASLTWKPISIVIHLI
jgi:hypothetical protein